MIKKLSLKFVLVSLVLVVSVIITSSCYAFSTDYIAMTPFTVEDLIRSANITDSEDYVYHVICFQNISSGEYIIRLLRCTSSDSLYTAEYFYGYNNYVRAYSPNGIKDNSSGQLRVLSSSFGFTYSNNSLTYNGYNGIGSEFIVFSDPNEFVVADITTLPVKTSYGGTVIYEPFTASVEVTHEFQSDTSAKVSFDYSSYGTEYVLKYSLTGVALNTDLTAPLELKNPVTYTPRGK